MLHVIFTLDYEIHGNGEGCPWDLMVEPTDRLLRLFEEYGAKLTIMADVAEILKFKEYAEQYGKDDYHYDKIVEQLREALRRGHDVQLHLHASYLNARFNGRHWQQDWSEYNFAGLSHERLDQVVKLGKDFLESLLRPVDPAYHCNVFRAANWSVSPSANVVRALVNNGFTIDTSVFKYGRREGIVNFDYTSAWSGLVPWRVKEDDICAPDANGKLFEFPIYSERRWVGAFLTPQRIYRACLSRWHRLSDYQDSRTNGQTAAPPARPASSRQVPWLARKHAWKADFNQCGGRQLIRALKDAEAEYGGPQSDLPFVLIGHSKLFTPFNARTLRPFLSFVAKATDRFRFARFSDFDLQTLGAAPTRSG